MYHGWQLLPLAAALAAPAAYAAQYMSIEAAQRAAFPEATAFTPLLLSLDADARARLAAMARPPARAIPSSGASWRARGCSAPSMPTR